MSTPPNERPPETEPVTGEHRSTNPLVWLILLIALAALVWYFATRSDAPDTPLEPIAPAADMATGDGDADAGDDADAPAAAAPTDRAPAASAPADRPAEPMARVEPAYPAAALRSREEGTVLLRVEVDAEGNPTSVDVETSSRSRDLDRAARDAVRQWTFSPAIEGGQPVASVVTVPVDFRVEEQ